MKAITVQRYGGPEVLKLSELEQPVPNDNEVLIKVKASSVTPMDWKFRSGKTFIARLITGLFKPQMKVFGIEFSGEIAAVGSCIEGFKIHDPVFGRAKKGGAHAEYICVPEKEICKNPSSSSFEEAAGITFGATNALYGLRKAASIKSGQKVLINGASGGVGTFAVQLAKYFGAEVTAVCSTNNLRLIDELGADNAIDYTKEDFTQNGKTYDLIFDCVGKRTYSECKNSLALGGLYISNVLTFSLLLNMFSTSKSKKRKAKFIFADFEPEDLLFLKDLTEKGVLKTVIDKSYSLEEIIEAHKYAELGHARGKVILKIGA